MSTHCDREHFCDQNNNEDKHVNGACEESDDDAVTLSADALRALQEFYSESQSPQKKVQVDENWVSCLRYISDIHALFTPQ